MAVKGLIVACAMVIAAPAFTQEDPARTERVELAPSAPARSYTDSIGGFERVKYLIGLREGQTLSVTLATSNLSNCFDITAPGAAKPMFVGGTSGSSHTFRAPAGGDYVIDVHLLRLAARDNQSALYTLDVTVTE